MLKKLISLMIATSMALSLITVPTYSVSAANTTIKLGDYVQMGTYDTDGDGTAEPILWRCVAFEKISGYDDEGNPIIDSTDTVKSYKDGYLPLMLADTSLCDKVFDEAGDAMIGSHSRGPNSGSNSRAEGGSSYWGDSNIRDWLNCDEETVVYTCGNRPDYANEIGFLKNFTDEEKKAIITVNQKSLLIEYDYKAIDGSKTSGTAANRYHSLIEMVTQGYETSYSEQITDTMFLLDLQQIYNVYFNYAYLGYEDYYALSKDYWLRSPSCNNVNSVRYVAKNGKYVRNARCNYRWYCDGMGVRPAFFLDLSSANFTKGTGTKKEPYTLEKNEKLDTKVVTYPTDHGAIIFDTETGIITGAEGIFLTTLEIPEKINGVTVTEIGDEAFKTCDFIKSVTLPNTIVRIGNRAFEGSAIQSINIPSSVREIGDNAFKESYLKNITFDPGVTTIGGGAFYSTYLKSIVLPNTVENIGGNAFSEISCLQTAVLYGDVGFHAFAGDYCLTSVDIRGNCKSVGIDAFFRCHSLRDLQLCDGISEIGRCAFYECKCLTNITLPMGLNEIGTSAFGDTAIDNVILSEEITSLYFGDSFEGEDIIKELYIPKSLTYTDFGIVRGNRDGNKINIYYGGTKEQWQDLLNNADCDITGKYNIAYNASPSMLKNSASSNKVGNLCVFGGVSGKDYSYSGVNNTLTILSSEAMTVVNYDDIQTYVFSDEELSLNSIDEVASGQAVNALAFSGNDEVASGQAVTAFADDDDYSDSEITNTRIVIAKDVDAVLTFDGVDIDGEGEAVNALSLESGSSLDLTLMNDSSLSGGNDSVGIDVANGAELTVDGSGSLTLSGGSGAADIDGKAVINGGAITANGDIFGFEENVTFNGGIITFSDEYVNLSDDFDGVVYVGEIGEVHGDVVISQDTTLPEDTNLYIPADEATLTIAENALITIPSTSNLTITYGGKEITITPLDGKDCVMGTYGENGLDLYNGTIVIEGDGDLWLTCITVSDDGGVIIFDEDGSIEVPAETYVEINLDDGITVGQYGGIIRPNGTVTDNVSVLLDSQGGTFIFIQPVPTGDKITKPSDPTYDGYTFGGWYKEAECINAWDFENDTANENITLYAKWTATSDDNTGNTPDDKTDDTSSNSSSGKVSRGGGGGRSSSAAVKKAAAETEIIDEDKPNKTDETKEPVGTKNRFTDVKDGMWYTEAVDYAVENGLFFGTSDTLFSPNAQMTRGMIATVLYRAEGEPKTSTSVFTDVKEGEWYADAVNWAAENNIVSGFGNGLFKPNDNITREQLAAILYRYAGSPTTSNTALTFADANKVSDYATNALIWATENGIIYGKDNNTLDPQGEATRAEVAAMLMRYFTNTQ